MILISEPMECHRKFHREKRRLFWGDIDDENCENSVEKSEKSPKKKLEVKAKWMLHSAQFVNRESVYV